MLSPILGLPNPQISVIKAPIASSTRSTSNEAFCSSASLARRAAMSVSSFCPRSNFSFWYLSLFTKDGSYRESRGKCEMKMSLPSRNSTLNAGGKQKKTNQTLPWEPTTLIFSGYNPYYLGVKPSFFMVLGSKGRKCKQHNSFLIIRLRTRFGEVGWFEKKNYSSLRRKLKPHRVTL